MPQTSALDALRASVLAKELSLEDCDRLAPLVKVHTLADGEVVCPAASPTASCTPSSRARWPSPARART